MWRRNPQYCAVTQVAYATNNTSKQSTSNADKTRPLILYPGFILKRVHSRMTLHDRAQLISHSDDIPGYIRPSNSCRKHTSISIVCRGDIYKKKIIVSHLSELWKNICRKTTPPYVKKGVTAADTPPAGVVWYRL